MIPPSSLVMTSVPERGRPPSGHRLTRVGFDGSDAAPPSHCGHFASGSKFRIGAGGAVGTCGRMNGLPEALWHE